MSDELTALEAARIEWELLEKLLADWRENWEALNRERLTLPPLPPEPPAPPQHFPPTSYLL